MKESCAADLDQPQTRKQLQTMSNITWPCKRMKTIQIINVFSVELGRLPLVKTAANLFKTLCYNNKNNLMAGILCAGWDPIDGGSVYSIPLGGTLVKSDFGTSGSGSTYIYGYCDAHWKENMELEEGLHFVKTALTLAMIRDGSSGGVIRTAIINKDGVQRDMTPWTELERFKGE
jgi:20S proteasome subunit beta 1